MADTNINPLPQVNLDAADFRPVQSGMKMGATLSEMSELLKCRGLRVECRAKYSSGLVFYWARIVHVAGREMASSGGWYDREDDAVRNAILMLDLLETGSNQL